MATFVTSPTVILGQKVANVWEFIEGTVFNDTAHKKWTDAKCKSLQNGYLGCLVFCDSNPQKVKKHFFLKMTTNPFFRIFEKNVFYLC